MFTLVLFGTLFSFNFCLGQEFNTICQENEAWTYYGTACPDTCKNWALKIRRCTLEFKQGCFCVNGTVRDEKTNKCVKKEDCPEPPDCLENEEFRQEGYECGQCNGFTMVRCGLTKEPGCYCKDGYVRKTYRGECITYDECEANRWCQRKDIHSEYRRTKFCQLGCPSSNEKLEEKECPPGCRCLFGYYLHEGRCIPLEECPKQA